MRKRMRFRASPHPVAKLTPTNNAAFWYVGSILNIGNLYLLDLDISIAICFVALDQDVVRLDVGVNDALFVKRLNAAQCISKYAFCSRKRDIFLGEEKKVMRKVIVNEQ